MAKKKSIINLNFIITANVKAKPILPRATYFLHYIQTEPNCSENSKNHQR